MKALADILTTLIPFLAPYPAWVKMFVLGGVFAILLMCFGILSVLVLTHPRPYEQATGQLVQNGGFEQGFAHWGSGYVEDLVRNGNFPQQPQFPYVRSGRAQSTGTVDSTEHHDVGIASFRIAHTSPRADHDWGSLSQRITGLRRHTFYVIRFWAKVQSSDPKAVFLTADLRWEPNYPIPPVQSDWQQHQFTFNTGEADSVDLRFVAQAPALLWIDDVTMEEQQSRRAR